MSKRLRDSRSTAPHKLLPWRVFAALLLALPLATACDDAVGPNAGVAEVGFASEPPSTLEVGESVALVPLPMNEAGEFIDIVCTRSFHSSDESVATVSSTGVITAVSPGPVVITAGLNSVEKDVPITVVDPDDPNGDDDPTLQLSTEDMTFEAEWGGPNPDPTSIVVSSDGEQVSGLDLSIVYAAGQSTGWLTADLADTETEADIDLTVDIDGLTPGTYGAQVVVTGTDANPAVGQVTLIVSGDDTDPTLQLSVEEVAFEAEEGGDAPDAEIAAVTSDGGPVSGLAFQIIYTPGEPTGWLSGQLTDDSTETDLILTADPTGLAPGTYTARVIVTGDDANPAEAEVTLTVTDPDTDPDPAPAVELSVGNAAFTATVGEPAPAPRIVDVTDTDGPVNGLAVQIDYESGGPTGWLTAQLDDTTTPTGLELTADHTGLVPGIYEADVTVTGTDAEPDVARVRLTVQAAPPTQLVLSAGNAQFTATEGGANPAPQTVGVTSSDDEVSGLQTQISYANGQPTGWLTAQLDDTTTPTDLELSADITGLDPGVYSADVTVSGTDAVPAVVQVTLNVQNSGGPDPDPTLQLSVDDVDFEATEGEDNPDPVTTEVTSDGDEVSGLSIQIVYGGGQPTGWLTAQLDDTTTPTDLELSADITGLDPGVYTAQVIVSGTDANSAVAQVSLTVHDAPDLIGLELEVGIDLLPGTSSGPLDLPDVFDLDLTDLLSEPIVDVIVWGLYSDGSRENVTELAALDTDDPLLFFDGPGVLNLAGVLVAALTDPDHYVHAEYEGFETDATIHINVPILGDLPITGLEILDLEEGTQIALDTHLPAVAALLDDGLGGELQLLVPPDADGIEWSIVPADYVPILGPILGPIVNAVLQPLGNLVGSVLDVSEGVVSGLNLGILNPILSLLGGVLQVDISAVVDGVTSPGIPVEIPL